MLFAPILLAAVAPFVSTGGPTPVPPAPSQPTVIEGRIVRAPEITPAPKIITAPSPRVTVPRPDPRPLCPAGPVVVVHEDVRPFPCVTRPGQFVTLALKWRPTIEEQLAKCDQHGAIPHQNSVGDFFCVAIDI